MNYTINTNKGEFLLVEIPSRGINFFINMGYLIFKTPKYENWVTDDELENPVKLQKYLKRTDGSEQWKSEAIKLPDGNFKLMAVTKSFVTNKHEISQNLTEEIAGKIVDERKNTIDSLNRLLVAEKIDSEKSYAIFQKQTEK